MKNCTLLATCLLYAAFSLAQPAIYTDTATLITGTWIGKGTLTEISGNTPFEGTRHYQFTYNFDGHWAGFGLNMDNWGSGPLRNLSGYTHLRLAYRGLSAGHRLTISLRRGEVLGPAVEIGGVNAAYTVVEIPIISLTAGGGVAVNAISEITLSVGSDPAVGSGVLYLDDIRMVNAGKAGAPASDLTWRRAESFTRGVNMSNWLEAFWLLPFNSYPETNRYTRARFAALAAAGFEAFRLPITFEQIAGGPPDYPLNVNQPAYALIDSAIRWAADYDVKLIIDNHHGLALTDANYQAELPRLRAIWRQIIQRYGQLDPERYFFELYNEPNGISNANFRTIAQTLVDDIRAAGSTHTLIVGASGWNSGGNLVGFAPLEDDNILYTFHFYDPYFFTHQGMSWTSPPYLPNRLFPQGDEVAQVQNLFRAVSDWSAYYDVPVFLGEFGVSTAAPAASRCAWMETVMDEVDAAGFSHFYWDAISPTDAFGFFAQGIIDEAHAIDCFVESLGLYMPVSVGRDVVVDAVVRVFPNPAAEWLNVSWEDALGSMAYLHLVSPDGKLVKTYPVTGGSTAASLPLPQVPAGIYRLVGQSAEGRYWQRPVVIRQ